jgi:hypothetical protein
MSYFGFSGDYGPSYDSGSGSSFGSGSSSGSGSGSEPNYNTGLNQYGRVYANGCAPYGGGIGPNGDRVTVYSSI